MSRRKGKVLFILLLLTCVIILSSCETSSSSKKRNEDMKQSIENSIYEDLQVSEDTQSAADIGESIKINFAQNVKVEVLEINENTATLLITAPNMKEILSDIFSENAKFDQPSQELNRIEEYVYNRIQNKDFSLFTKEITVETEKEEDEVKIIENDEYLDAINGGMLSFYTEIAEAQENK